MKSFKTLFFTLTFLLLGLTTYAQADSLFWKPIENSECLFWENHIDTNKNYKWDGDCKDGFIHGEGKLEYIRPDNKEEWYKGRVENGKFNGFGIYKLVDDSYYEGEFKDGKFHGEGLSIAYSESFKYKGEFKEGEFHGYGIAIFHDSSRYEGEWENGKMHGSGKYTFDDGSGYTGEWENDLKHGKGVYVFASGARYEGEFYEGEQHGKGEYYYSNGNYYIGEFKEGYLHGEGKFFSADGWTFIGELINDDPYNGVVIDSEDYIIQRVTDGDVKRVYGKEKWEGE